MSRNYKNWLELIAKHSGKITIRHDIDFDINTCRAMMKAEKSAGLTSVVYFDVNSPSYGIEEIQKLYQDFKDFEFGIHINTAYDYPPREAYKKFQDNVNLLKKYVPIKSCAGHYYDSKLILPPGYNNVTIETESDKKGFLPSFSSYYGPFASKYGDGGGLMPYPMETWLKTKTPGRAYVQIHPTHYVAKGEGIFYTKRILSGIESDEPLFKEVARSTTPFFSSISPAVSTISEKLTKYAQDNYRKLIRIVDAGCGVGYLGINLQQCHNVKYIGIDKEPQFIDAGRKFYAKLGYAPDLRTGNIYKHCPDGDILVYIGYEDCETDHDALLEVCRKFPQAYISIVTEDRMEEAIRRDKWYHYIAPKDFEKKYGSTFEMIRFETNKRYIYHLTRKQNA